MKSKIIQFSTCQIVNGHSSIMLALCEDGSMWWKHVFADHTKCELDTPAYNSNVTTNNGTITEFFP